MSEHLDPNTRSPGSWPVAGHTKCWVPILEQPEGHREDDHFSWQLQRPKK